MGLLVTMHGGCLQHLRELEDLLSVALVADTELSGDLSQQIDDQIKEWADLVSWSPLARRWEGEP